MAWGIVTFDTNGGSGGYSSLYVNSDIIHSSYNINYWATQQSTSTSYRVTSMTVPTKSGKRFAGYYYDSFVLCNCDGNLSEMGSYYFRAELSFTTSAVWSDPFSVINISRAGGTGGTSYFYRRNADGACFLNAKLTNRITSISIPERDGYRFVGLSYGGVKIVDSNGNILPAMSTVSIDSDVTISSEWIMSTFGAVTDYFNLGNANLIPESSDSGESKPHIVAYNATTSSTSADNVVATETGPAWRNPSVTYRVVGDMTLGVTLGAAFPCVHNGLVTNPPTATGYMITSVAISTEIGKPPTVTVSAVANEGYTIRYVGTTAQYTSVATPAIKTYTVSIPISARHRPQNLMNAISTYSGQTGGDLQQVTLTATCDPVVVSENNMPCASDVCHGRIDVAAVTNAYANEAEPQAGSGFVQVGAPLSRSGTGYKTWNVKLRKDL